MLSGQNLFCQSFDLAYVRTHSSKIIIIIIIIILIIIIFFFSKFVLKKNYHYIY